MIKVLHVTFDLKLGGTQQVIRQIVANMNGFLDEDFNKSEK